MATFVQLPAVPETEYTRFDVEAALCVWEWVLEQLSNPNNAADVIRAHIDCATGTNNARLCAMDIGVQIADWWTETIGENGDPNNKAELLSPFDWEFVPAVMAHLLERCTPGARNLFKDTTEGDIRDACDAVLKDALEHDEAEKAGAAAKTTITIHVSGGVVNDVDNLPPGWNFDIIDHDDDKR